VENFVGHLQANTSLICDGKEGRKSSVILDFVSASPQDGTEVSIDYDDPPDMSRTAADGLRLLE
jgi:hypothetical protein